MRNSIAVMNTKGGVGKSTVVMALAETLSAFHGKNVLVIDSDAQASVSSMLMTVNALYKLQTEGLTIVDYLVTTVLQRSMADWQTFVVRNVSDVDDARSVYLIPSDMQLTLLEREVSKESLHAHLRGAIAHLLAEVSQVFDVVLIDCPPGLSVLTECWLREASFHMSPTKADYVSLCGLEVFRRFKALNPEMGFAENLGVLVNMFDPLSPSDEEYRRWLAENPEHRCFATPVPRSTALQDAARHLPPDRSYTAKFPGPGGLALRRLAEDVLARLAEAERDAAATPPPPSPPAEPKPVAAPTAAVATATAPAAQQPPAKPASPPAAAAPAAQQPPAKPASPPAAAAPPAQQPPAKPASPPAAAAPPVQQPPAKPASPPAAPALLMPQSPPPTAPAQTPPASAAKPAPVVPAVAPPAPASAAPVPPAKPTPPRVA